MLNAIERKNPFPGLRPFEFGEEYLFFGREGQADELLRRLQKKRFVAVVGTSGSGKSSLVRAGLLPALYSGFLQGAGSDWRVAIIRPGGAAIQNLAMGLNKPEVFGQEGKDAPLQAMLLETTLRSGSLGLVEVTRQARMQTHEHLLVVVDQFEELFRFHQNDVNKGENEEAKEFVKLLLSAVQQMQLPIYIVLTMRSDFLGDCARFVGLPEAINESQYLIPRMTRDQRRAAIEGPIRVIGAKISSVLVQRLLNDVGDNPDHLPILQHALMRTWNYWLELGNRDEPIGLHHYEAVGTMASALSNHADSILDELTEGQQKVAKRLFQRLTERTADRREIRRPASLIEVAKVAQVSVEEVQHVVNQFRKEGSSFLIPPEPEPLSGETLLDISHESLMRVWERLKDWVDEEKESAQNFVRLAGTASLYQQERASLLQPPELTYSMRWLEEEQPNPAWAKRYSKGFENVQSFLKKSVEEEERATHFRRRAVEREARAESEKRILRALLWGGAVAIFLASILTSWAFREREQAEQERNVNEMLFRALDVEQRLSASPTHLETSIRALELGERVNFFDRSLQSSLRWKALALLSEIVNSNFYESNRIEAGSGRISSVMFDPYGSKIASAGSDGTVRLWEADGSSIATLEGHSGSVTSVVFSSDGSTLASAGIDRTVRLWGADGNPIATLEGHSGTVTSVVFGPDGSTLASASFDGTVRVWGADGTELSTLCVPSETPLQCDPRVRKLGVTDIAFSPDGSTLVSADQDGTLLLWSIDGSAIETIARDVGAVTSVEFSPDGSIVLAAFSNGVVRLFGANGTKLSTLEGHSGPVSGIAFGVDGSTIASAGSDGTVRLWDLNGSVIAILEGHAGEVSSLAFSSDGKTLVTAGGDGTLRLWEANESESTLVPFEGHAGQVSSVVFGSDDNTLASAGADGTVRLWGIDGSAITTLEGHAGMVNDVTINNNKAILASAGQDGTVRLWESDGSAIATIEGHIQSVYSVAFSPDGSTLASTGFDRTVRLWRTDGSPIATLDGHSKLVYSVAFSPDSVMLASAGADGTVRLWKTDGSLITTLEGHTRPVSSVTFGPNGSIVASASSDGTVRLWRIDGSSIATLEAHTGEALGVAFSPDGHTLASAGSDGNIKLWGSDGSPIATFEVHDGPVSDVAFGADNYTIAFAGSNGTVRVLNYDLDVLMAQGCARFDNYHLQNRNDWNMCENWIDPISALPRTENE